MAADLLAVAGVLERTDGEPRDPCFTSSLLMRDAELPPPVLAADDDVDDDVEGKISGGRELGRRPDARRFIRSAECLSATSTSVSQLLYYYVLAMGCAD